MSRSSMDSDINNNELCAVGYSKGARDFFEGCGGLAGVFWDVNSTGPFNWTVPDFNIFGNQRVEGELEITNNGETPGAGVTLYCSGNSLMARLPNGQTVQIAPPGAL